MNKYPLLSICIPTYNRCAYLKAALDNIISSEGFDKRVEVVISDNASIDNTSEMIVDYIDRFENIKYYRNNINVEDENFYIALNHATGKYIRLFNDTLRFNSGRLAYMLDIIENSNENSLLFFFQNIDFLNKNVRINFSTKTDILKNTTFYITWIANFGCWQIQYKNISEPCKYKWTKLLQVEWIFQLFEKNSNGIIYFNDFFTSIYPSNKGGYNLFDVFINNYLYLLKLNFQNSKHTFLAIEKEKYSLFRYFILPWYRQLVLNKTCENNFKLEKASEIIFSKYYKYPYYWIGMTIIYLRKILPLRKIIKQNN